MPLPTLRYATLDEWIAREAIAFDPEHADSLKAAIDRLLAAHGNKIDLLGFGEPYHGGDDFLILRNRIFQRLVAAHGFTAIAIESSFPRSRVANEYVMGRGSIFVEDALESGFSHGVGRLGPNRELVAWVRSHNADRAPGLQLRLYGFDGPMEMVGTDSPRQLLEFALGYLTSLDATSGNERWKRIDALLGDDATWQNPDASFDPAKSIGGSTEAAALRIETEDLVMELAARRPELIQRSDIDEYSEAMRYAAHARQLLDYHAGLARSGSNRIAELLGMRDVMMADNLAYIVERERRRGGRVLAFAHNSHLKCGPAEWQLGSDLLTWWPAGAHLRHMLDRNYAVIGTGVGVSEANSIAAPEPGTLEALVTSAAGPARFVPTHRGVGLPPPAIDALAIRSTGTNSSYFPYSSKSITEYDWLAVLDSVE